MFAALVMILAQPLLPTVEIAITNEVVRTDVERIGIVLSGPNDYGAENYMANWYANPGFEASYFASTITCSKADNSNIVQAQYWDVAWNTATIGWPVGMWDGGEWELPAQGIRGKIIKFSHVNSKYTWELDRTVSVGYEEVMYVRVQFPGNGNEPRPNSPGTQSTKLTNPGNNWKSVGNQYWDLLATQGDNSAGVLRLMQGPYMLSFWAKGPAKVKVKSTRGSVILLEKIFDITDKWEHYSYAFEAKDTYQTGKSPGIQLGWTFESGTSILLDDIYLGRSDKVSGFSQNLIDSMKELHPGVIREWQGNHGVRIKDKIADEYARHLGDHSPRNNKGGARFYGWVEFLDLCEQVDAVPWLNIPPTASLEDLTLLKGYLNAVAPRFKKVYVEFANESWGSNNRYSDPFAGGSFNGGARFGAAARRAFEFIGPVKGVQYLAGGQASWTDHNRIISEALGGTSRIMIAPYFGELKDKWDTPENILLPVYGRAFYDIVQGKPFAAKEWVSGVYEINFHTTGGAGGDKSIVNNMVAGVGGGIALPVYILNYIEAMGWQPNATFNYAQYSANGIRIWGQKRDSEATGRWRPTGMAVILANKLIGNNSKMLRVHVNADVITAPAINGLPVATTIPGIAGYAFEDKEEVRLLLVNLWPGKTWMLDLPTPSHFLRMGSDNPWANNEDGAGVVFTNEYDQTLPPYSAQLLVWHKEGITEQFIQNGKIVSPFDKETSKTTIYIK